MNIKKLHNLFLLPLLLGLLSIVMPGCSDDDENALQSEYGYVQFKLYKTASFGAEEPLPTTSWTRSTMPRRLK